MLNLAQQEMLEYLRKSLAINGYQPSVRELARLATNSTKNGDVKSPADISNHLRVLETGKFIAFSPRVRAIEILQDKHEICSQEVVDIPILSCIATSEPLITVANTEDIFPVPVNYVKNDAPCFMLRIRDNNMADLGVCDGDLVLVYQQSKAKEGDIIVALIGDKPAIGKVFSCDGKHINQSIGDFAKPILLKDCTIKGKVIGLYRRY